MTQAVNPTVNQASHPLYEAVRAAIAGGRADDALFARVAAYQREKVPPYARLLAASPHAALPTDVFRHARISTRAPEEITRIFRTSGTTQGLRGEHAFADLSLYDLAAERWAKALLFPDVAAIDLLILAPREDELPDSSLSYMLSRFEGWFGQTTTWAAPGHRPDLDQIAQTLRAQEAPIAILGTSFAFVHLLDAWAARGLRDVALPAGSRVMTTGGTKGRSREIHADELRAEIGARFSIPPTHIVSEYGMTELSSQAYETSLRDAAEGITRPRQHLFPPWVKISLVDPITLLPLDDSVSSFDTADNGHDRPTGILRIDDLANLESVSAILTSDRAQLHVRGEERGFSLLGRASGAQLRGCSLAVEEALSWS